MLLSGCVFADALQTLLLALSFRVPKRIFHLQAAAAFYFSIYRTMSLRKSYAEQVLQTSPAMQPPGELNALSGARNDSAHHRDG